MFGRGVVNVEFHSELLKRPTARTMDWKSTLDLLKADFELDRRIEVLLGVRLTGLHGVPADATNQAKGHLRRWQ